MSAKQMKVSVLVHPGAARSEVVSFAEGVWQVKVAAPPAKGKANKELIAFLSETLGVSKSSISLVKGLTSRHKLLVITGLSPDEVLNRLKPSSASGDAMPSRQSRRPQSRRD